MADPAGDLKTAIDMMLPPAPLAPLLQNTTSLQVAQSANTLGVGYSGSGLLLFYFIGVSKVLQQLRVIKPGHTKVAATSGGIIGCAPDFGIVDHDTFLVAGKDFVRRCRARHNCAGSLDSEVSRVVDRLLTADAHERLNGTAYITYAHPDANGVPLGAYTNVYESREHLYEAIRTGVYLPMWSGPSMTRTFKGMQAYDGGFRRQLPCPPDVSFCITVSALPPVTWADLVHSLLESDTMRLLQGALRSTLGKSPMQFVMNVLLPARNSNYRLGEVVYGMVAYFSNVNPDKAVSIYPGKYNKNPYSLAEWLLMLIIPPTPRDIDVMVEMGRRDAASWAAEHGLMSEADKAAIQAQPLRKPRGGE